MDRPPRSLGLFLRTAREGSRLTLRSVEESTGVSNAYLSQLEHGKIRQPSPVILHKLTELYAVSYSDAMRLAGYPVPEFAGTGTAKPMPKSFSRFGDITPDEESALGEYLDFLRSRRERE